MKFLMGTHGLNKVLQAMAGAHHSGDQLARGGEERGQEETMAAERGKGKA